MHLPLLINYLLAKWPCPNLGPSPYPKSLPHGKFLANQQQQQQQQQQQHIPTPPPSLPRTTSSSPLPLMNRDFPDPSILQDTNGTWYAFATASAGRNIQAASAPSPSGPWTYIDREILPSSGSWTLSSSNSNTWAPDVRLIGTNNYVMYYSGQLAGNMSAFHCIGAARSSDILGPYEPLDEPLVCPVSQGGAIDASGFYDEDTGRMYVLYKVDGNSIGHGGECNNGVEPYSPTPIVLQEVDRDDGVTIVGEGVEILDREEGDGPLVEAPSLVRVEDGGGGEVVYILFFSSHCWMTSLYRVGWAISRGNVTGPYVRGDDGGRLIWTGDGKVNLTAPGGATAVVTGDNGGRMVFHADCEEGRCLFEKGWEVEVGVVELVEGG